MSDDFTYALFTFQTGRRPMDAFDEIFNNLCATYSGNLDAIEDRSGSTHRYNLEIALSDTTILMTYKLVEGFFYEEYKFYIHKADEPSSLNTAIATIFKKLNIVDEDLISDANKICSLRRTRNAIAHRNGILKNSERQEIEKVFGTGISTSRGYPIADLNILRDLVNTALRVISRYSELALDRASNA